MNPGLRRSTLALLASSLLLTIGRGATLPFMTIYLNRQYGLGVDLIGYALTSALTIGVIFSLGFGILADKAPSFLSPGSSDLFFQATICFFGGFQRQYSRLAKLFMPPANIC